MRINPLVFVSTVIVTLLFVFYLSNRNRVKHEIIYKNGAPYLKSTMTSFRGWNKSGGFSEEVQIGITNDGHIAYLADEQIEDFKKVAEESLMKMDKDCGRLLKVWQP